jgi:ferrous iron transport protein B
MASAALTVALAGNPNSGKTTIFNNITGSRQHVGNYPGVTVERREGFRRFHGNDMLVVDLPGTYSLTAHSLDEVVARNVIIDEKPDIIVNILDTSNLERNLYLAVQLLELERPLVLALNMTDVAEKMGLKVDESTLSRKLGIPVVRTVGNRNRGTDDLLQTVADAASAAKHRPFALDYGPEIEARIGQITEAVATLTAIKYPLRWLAIKLLENDQDVNKAVNLLPGWTELQARVEEARTQLKASLGDDPEIILAEIRYRFVGQIYREVAFSDGDWSLTISDKIDSVLTHRLYGLPIFFGIMWLLFNIVFTLGHYPQDWLQSGVKFLSDSLARSLADSDLKDLLVDGIIGGVGSVITFLPNILLLFLGIALLEGTGYMARAAFVMDRVMRAVGLHGKSFIPLLLGFGCNVPAIMGTRTLENPRDRMVTILVSPLMSCSARLPVYTLLIAAFFPDHLAGSVLFSVYLFGIMLAVVMALLFRKTLFPGASEAFVMEMPPYHLPTQRGIATQMCERSVLYLKKAGTLILAASILVWFLTNYPAEVPYSQDYDQAKAQIEETFASQTAKEALLPLGIEVTEEEYSRLDQQRKDDLEQLAKDQASEKLANSYAGRFGHLIEPTIRPLGFDWKIGVGLVSAVAAKEVLVSTLGTIYSVGEAKENPTSLQGALTADPTFSPLVAYTLMIFTLIYSPCLAALAVIRRETNSWKWTAFSFTYSTALAWLIAFTVYQAGTCLGF